MKIHESRDCFTRFFKKMSRELSGKITIVPLEDTSSGTTKKERHREGPLKKSGKIKIKYIELLEK